MEGGRAINSYRDLDVWQDAMTLAVACYEFTKAFPREEMFGLTAHIRRAAASVAANIAEGHGRERTLSFIHFLRIAQGSLKELETHVILSSRVGIARTDDATAIVSRCESVGRQLRSLIRSLQRRAEHEGDAR